MLWPVSSARRAIDSSSTTLTNSGHSTNMATWNCESNIMNYRLKLSNFSGVCHLQMGLYPRVLWMSRRCAAACRWQISRSTKERWTTWSTSSSPWWWRGRGRTRRSSPWWQARSQARDRIQFLSAFKILLRNSCRGSPEKCKILFMFTILCGNTRSFDLLVTYFSRTFDSAGSQCLSVMRHILET